MIILVSPAKTLDFDSKSPTNKAEKPLFTKQSEKLIKELQKLKPDDIKSLMSISDKLAELNYNRFQEWTKNHDKQNAKQAVFAFKGDVYTGLDAESLSPKEIDFCHKHLRILSGLYGMIRPLDFIQPYRLEMGTKFPENKLAKNLYEFWKETVTDEVNDTLKKMKSNLIINLASNEYFKVIDTKKLDGKIVSPVFKDEKKGTYKVIAFYAKKARGLMTRYIIKNNITDTESLQGFDYAGYSYNPEMSKPNEPVFTRPEQ